MWRKAGLALAMATVGLGAIGCQTVTELTSPNDTALNYAEVKKPNGETVYRRIEPTPAARAERDRMNAERAAQRSPLSSGFAATLEAAQPAERASAPGPIRTQERVAIPGPAPAAEPSAKPEPAASNEPRLAFGLIEGSGGGEHFHLAAALGARVAPYFEPRLGVAWFRSNDSYLGFDLGARAPVRIFGSFAVFVGAGAYVGDAKSCRDESPAAQVCDKTFLGAAFVEAGAEWDSLYVFARRMGIERAGVALPAASFFGLGFRW